MTDTMLLGTGNLASASTKRIRIDLMNIPGMRTIEVFCREPGGVSLGVVEAKRECATLQLSSEHFERLRAALLDREPSEFELSLSVDGSDVTELNVSGLHFEFALFQAPTQVEFIDHGPWGVSQ
ncbi:MAG TPA: hypothetical protein VKP30_05675 [Polyangiaceae bacterium]|nr:hypothetical protein [Polyangiaceae bacterium]